MQKKVLIRLIQLDCIGLYILKEDNNGEMNKRNY